MRCKARIRLLAVGLVAIAVLLAAPAAGFAADAPPALLASGAGYGSPEGSQPVRELQRQLRRLGDAPGPVDGLYGPLTKGAVLRFQQEHALAEDGVVGPQTRGRLVAERRKLRPAKLERKSPARVQRAESVPERPAPRSASTPPPQRAAPVERGDPESSTAVAPGLAAAVGGLALALLLVVLWRLARRRRDGPRREARTGPRLGLVCAALLAAYVIGAATGAVFATHAAPDDRAKQSTASVEPRAR